MNAVALAIKVQDLVEEARQTEFGSVVVTGLALDSRKVRPGDCFLAFPGHVVDGRDFIQDALQRGAVAVLAEAHGLQAEPAGSVIAVADLQRKLGAIAGRFFQFPSNNMSLIAVTGTNGKTTVTQLIAHALLEIGHKAGVIGTLGNGPVGELAATGNTTPDVVAVNALLWQMLQQGIDAVAMEASSHGLVQGRLDDLALHTGVITNLSRDHLDYHGSMEAYRDAKALLAQHPSLRHLVLNADDDAVVSMRSLASASCHVSTFSLQPAAQADIKAIFVEFAAHGLVMEVDAQGERLRIESPLVGEFNAANLLAALAALLTMNIAPETACAALSKVRPVAGRMQMVDIVGAMDLPAVVVDFAHTPDALEKVLVALRRHCPGLLWCVFGCGGDRDAGKRPLMGKAVANFADRMVVTSDNPRGEKPARIIADIVKGIPTGTAFEIIEDRSAAIGYAIRNAGPADLVLLAGKGHEDYQEIQGVKHPFSDVKVALDALQMSQQARVNDNG